MTFGPGLLRIASAISLASILVVVANLAPQLLGGLSPFARLGPETFYGAALILIAILWLRWGGTLDSIQSRGAAVLLELLIVAALTVGVTFVMGLGLSPLDLCIGGGGGYTCYPSLSGFAGGLVGLASVVLAEELFFRAYLINEMNLVWGWKLRAILSSAAIFTALHIPALHVEGFGTVSVLGFAEVLAGALTLSFCYFYSGRNLAGSIFLHGYWDGVGALILLPDAGPVSPVLTLLLQLSLPAAALMVLHSFIVTRSQRSPVAGKTSQPQGHSCFLSNRPVVRRFVDPLLKEMVAQRI